MAEEERVLRQEHVQLGVLEFDPDEGVWVATLTRDNRPIRVRVGGEREPDRQLVDRAVHLFEDFEAFKSQIVEFLRLEGAARPHLADALRVLTIGEVCLFWPDRPGDAMVFFAAPDSCRIWHCDYLGGQPSGLSFDS